MLLETQVDAREFAVNHLLGGWHRGLLVARNVIRLPPGGDQRSSNRKLRYGNKSSADEFAEAGGKVAGKGISQDTVLRYLSAWDAAAEDDYVPASSTLYPGKEVKLNPDKLTAELWDEYYGQEIEKAVPKEKRNRAPAGFKAVASTRSKPTHWVDKLVPARELPNCDTGEPDGEGPDEMDYQINVSCGVFYLMLTQGEVFRLNQEHLGRVVEVLNELLELAEQYEPVEGKSLINHGLLSSRYREELLEEVITRLTERTANA